MIIEGRNIVGMYFFYNLVDNFIVLHFLLTFLEQTVLALGTIVFLVIMIISEPKTELH